MSEYFPEPKSTIGKVKVELDLSDYAMKADFKNVRGIDKLKCAKKVDLASLKSNVDKLHIDKLKNVPSGLSSLKSKVDKLDIGKLETTPVDYKKLSPIVKNDVVKKTEYNAKIKSAEDKIPDITNLAIKTILNAKINKVKGEIPSTTNVAATTALNAKINEVKDEIPNITKLATTNALTAVENKVPSVSNLVKKTEYNTKINEIEKFSGLPETISEWESKKLLN